MAPVRDQRTDPPAAHPKEDIVTITSDLFLAAADLERRLGILAPGAAPARFPQTRSSALATLVAVAALVALLALGVAGAGARAPHGTTGTTWQPTVTDTRIPLRVRQLERDPRR